MDLNEQECIELEDDGITVKPTFVDFLNDIISRQDSELEAIKRMHIRAHIRIHA